MKQFLMALDQMVNTLIPAPLEGFGMADELISARAWRLRKSKSSIFWQNLHYIVDTLFFWEHGSHCFNAYLGELERKQLPDHYYKNG
jgi:hypothetical protein